jgi:predicted Zn-dependent protease
MNSLKLTVAVIGIVLLSSCGILNEQNKGKGLNLFSIQQDMELGAQVAGEIQSNPTEYPLLDSVRYKEVYQYVYSIRNTILQSGNVDYKNEFKWQIRIIQDDKTLNAFCTPGGYIYVYTGILKFLDSEDQLAGVLGHEIAHADMRHSTRQMTTQYGVQFLLDVLAGDRQALKQISGALIGLKFSRNHEIEADKCSVEYLCGTKYNADGGAGFFEKIAKQGGSSIPEFLSTHPDPGNRIENYRNNKVTMGCTGNNDFKSAYTAMKAKLP